MRGVNNHTQQKLWDSEVPQRAHLSAALLSVTSLFLLRGVKQPHTDCQRFLLALHFCSALPHIIAYLRLAGRRLTYLTQMHAHMHTHPHPHTHTHLHMQPSNLGQSTIKISTKSWALPWRCKENNSNTYGMPEGMLYYGGLGALMISTHTHTPLYIYLSGDLTLI